MKKSYLILGLSSLLLVACGGGDKAKNEAQKEFTVIGKFIHAGNSEEGKQVYLQSKDIDSDTYTPIDTATITNGAFIFNGTIGNNPEIRYISTGDMPRPVLVVAEEGAIEVSIDSTHTPVLKGTELNNKLQTYADARASYDNEMRGISKLAKEIDPATKMAKAFEAELEAKYDSVYNASKEYVFKFAKENINNIVGEYVFLDRGKSFDEKQLAEIIPLASAKLKESSKFKTIEHRFNALQATAVGQNYVDLTGKTPEGNTTSLSDYVGKDKYVLIDFWASWCPPCRKEMPNLVALYNQYKDKGFEIVGVSLDKTNEDWSKGIKDLNITWPQISDLKYWESDLSAAYAVSSIPHLVLIDKKGKIIAKGLNSEELSKQLAELFK